MYVDINGYDTKSAQNIEYIFNTLLKGNILKSFLYKGSSLWKSVTVILEGIYINNWFQT